MFFSSAPIRSCRRTARFAAAGVILAGLAAAPLAHAVPPNDDCPITCANHIPGLKYGANAFDTGGATDSGPTDTCTSSSGVGTTGFHIHNDVWFYFVPNCTGVTTINTCGTGFDTVLAVYSGCPYHTVTQGPSIFCIYDSNLAIACNDDFVGCGFNNSVVTFYATAGTEYEVRVGAFASGVTGLGTINVTGPACTYPTATITSPAALSCNCLPITITGEADAASGTFVGYTLEARRVASIPWTLVASSFTAVPATGTLATWNDITLIEGYHELRLTVLDAYGQRAQDETIIYVNRGYDSVIVRSPHDYNPVTGDGIYGGELCIDGTVYDGCGDFFRVEYSTLSTGPYNAVNPGTPTYPGTVINDPIGGNWNTRVGPTAVSDGSYFVRVTGGNACGQIATQTRHVLIDNTSPVALISSPAACSYEKGTIQIRGTATDANIAGWTLQYAGGSSSAWTTIASGSANMPAGSTLANWNAAGLNPCPYVLRLLVSDKAVVGCIGSNTSEYLVAIDLGCLADINRSGAVTVQDIFDFLAAYFAGCP
jgi:hypothetical protein